MKINLLKHILSEWIQTEINEINNAFSATPIIQWLQTDKSRACLRYGYRVFYRKASHNGNESEFRCSTPGYNAAIWLKLDSVNFAESNLLKTRFHRKNSL